MAHSLDLLTTVTQTILNPCLRSHGIKTGRAKLGNTVNGFVCAEIPVQHEENGLTGTLSISAVTDCFAAGTQWTVFVCRISVDGRQPVDKACIHAGADRLRREFGELIESFLTAPESSGPPPSLRRSTVVVE